MVVNKVELCGVNTSKLPLLREKEKEELFRRIRQGDKLAREEYIKGNLRLVLSVMKRFDSSNENADDLFQIGCVGLVKAVDNFDPDHIIVLSGDQICTMDYDKMLQYHKEKGADCTISVLNVTYEEAKRFGIMNTDEDERIYEFEEKPAEPKSTKASMGIYIFKWKLIRQYLIDDGNDPESEHDFGKNIIPRMLEDGRKMYAYSFDGYWRDVGTIDSLWEANMELLDENPQIDLNDDKMRIYTRNFSLPPHFVAPGASVKNSILADGCIIEGEVENCVIHSGVKIGKGSVVKNSVIMKDTVVRTGCQIDKALIDEEVVIEQGCKVGEGNNVTVIGYHCVALENATVEDGAMIYPDTILH